MAEQYRATLSIVYWANSAEDAQTIADAIKDKVPVEDQDAVLVTIEYKAEGKPEVPPPIEMPTEPATEPAS